MKKKVKKFIPQFVRNYYHLLQSFISNVIYRFPSRGITVIGVTGTDGKTTTVNLIYHLLKSNGQNVSMISTVNAVIGDENFDTGFHVTSPDPWLVPKYIRKAVKAGSKYMILEVTSHALDQFRMAGIKYDIGVITNITHEHLDYHKTYEKYLKAKAKLLHKSEITIINADDESYNKLKLVNQNSKQLSYGIKNGADIYAVDISYHLDKTEFDLHYNQTAIRNVIEDKKLTKKKDIKLSCTSPLLGDYNVSNLLAAISACMSVGLKAQDMVPHIMSFKTITGRLEEIDIQGDFRVIIDFAHTPGSFSKVLPLAKKLITEKNGRLIHIFGTAGLRDDRKRPIMGEISAKYADFTLLTAEDPRTEDVNEIISQIAKGCEKSQMVHEDYLRTNFGQSRKAYFNIPDRQEAISFAINKLVRGGDLIIITGKGHEKSMCFGIKEYPWNDHEAVEKAINQRNNKQPTT